MACQTGTTQFCKYVQEESKRIRTAILDPHHIRYSQLNDVPSLQQPGFPKGPGPRDFIRLQNINDGRAQNRRRRRKHQREVPPSSSRPPPCWALPVAPIPITKTSSASGDDETASEKTRREKLCSMIRKYGRCTRQSCLKWHPVTGTMDTQKLEKRQAPSSPPTTKTIVTKFEIKQSKESEHYQQQVTKQVRLAPELKVQPQRKSTTGLMDQITKITNPDWDDSEDEDESRQDPDPREDKIYIPVDQPKRPEISPHFQRYPPSKAKGKRQHFAVAAMGDDGPIPLEAAWVWGLAGGLSLKSSLALAPAPARLSDPALNTSKVCC